MRNHKKPWTTSHDQALTALVRTAPSVYAIAKALGRTQHAVALRVCHLLETDQLTKSECAQHLHAGLASAVSAGIYRRGYRKRVSVRGDAYLAALIKPFYPE